MDFDLLYNTIPDNFLTRIDRANMLAWVETRSPFLDYRLIEYSRRIPSSWKIPVRERKDFLKNLLKPYLAKEILTRKKWGYTPPIYEWIEEIMWVAKNSYSSLGKIRLTREYILERFIELYRK
jgi:asparagine synthase (glutamine-hydrolysing)